jgi:prepilin-type processing-associated H-X9-DG protein
MELLVVVAIVAGLAAILWPYRPPREKGRLARCTQNQKRLALALTTYCVDNGDHLPPADRWSKAIASYAQGNDLLTCPGDDRRRWRHGGGPYALSASLSGADLAKVASPDRRPMLWDARPNGEFVLRHGGGGVIAFADGHAKWHTYRLPGMDRGFVGHQER